MECKGSSNWVQSSALRDLIETLWNVKFRYCNNYAKVIGDLIETLWNVKIAACCAMGWYCIDLIETLWNVKVIVRVESVFPVSGFNRDIVECKDICQHIINLKMYLI